MRGFLWKMSGSTRAEARGYILGCASCERSGVTVSVQTTSTIPNYSPGLEGVIAGVSAICNVDPDAGLFYRGYDVHDLVQHSNFEETAFLVLHGKLPSKIQLEDFTRQLVMQRDLAGDVVDVLGAFPRRAHPMDSMRAGILALGALDPDLNDTSHAANVRKSIRIIARTATIVAAAYRLGRGQEPITPRNDLSHSQNFLYMLTGKTPDDFVTRALDVTLICYMEHEFNASTFSARVTASTLSDIYAAITSAIGTLKGKLHGGANEEVMKMLIEIGSPDKAEAWVRERLARREKIMGFGHRVYKHGDSRVDIVRGYAKQLGERMKQPQWYQISEIIERIMKEEKNQFPNVDFPSAAAYYLMGLPIELYTPIFAVSRVVGWCAHVTEQQDANRLIRPRSYYSGPQGLKYVPIHERQ
jgi:citrate synthase